jgi:hypothetical protein
MITVTALLLELPPPMQRVHQCIDEILCSIGDFAIDNTSWPAALLRENPAT